MKKLIITAIAAATIVTGATAVSAAHMPCTYADCLQAGYCPETCVNYNMPYQFGKGMQQGMGRRGHHGGYCCGNNAYCPYR